MPTARGSLKPESRRSGQGKAAPASRETPLLSTPSSCSSVSFWGITGQDPGSWQGPSSPCSRKGLQGEISPSLRVEGPEEEAPSPTLLSRRAALCPGALCWWSPRHVRPADLTPWPDSPVCPKLSPALKSLPHPRSPQREEVEVLWPSPFSRNKWRGTKEEAWGRYCI